MRHVLRLAVVLVGWWAALPLTAADPTRVLVVVGPSDHPPGSHEVAAGGRLLKHCLENTTDVPDVRADVVEGWPDQAQRTLARCVVFIGDTFPANRLPDPERNLTDLDAMMRRGCGIACVHYATGLLGNDVSPDGDHPLLRWLGGYFANRSCAHHQSIAKFFERATITPAAPSHPVSRGWKEFTLHDEPYINNYFGPGNVMAPNVTALATSMLPPDAPRRETVAWCVERPGGGRGFAIVMPHFYRNWRDENLRRFILNGVVWSAGLDVPAEGVTTVLPDLQTFAPAAVEPARPPRTTQVPVKAGQDHVNKQESAVPAYTLPDVLAMQDGRPVRTADDWIARRRPEILGLYERQIFGRTPPGLPQGYEVRVVEDGAVALGGTARRTQAEIRVSDRAESPVMHLLLYTPAEAAGPVPVFLCLHFSGNWTVVDDPGVNLHPTLDRKTRTMVMPPEDAPRGQSKEWDVPLVLSRGYGIAFVRHGDIEPDLEKGEGLPWGVRASYLEPGQAAPADDAWGAIGAWAWGLSRAIDFLLTNKHVAGDKIIAFGMSRLGKTVLWASAQDPRIALVIASCSGEGGASLSRRDFGENVDNMTTTYLYQFCRNFARFHRNWDALPVDAHMLVALTAPRPLLLNTGSSDLWSDPRGEFLAAQAASPVYALFGKRGLADEPEPTPDVPILNDLGYHMHTGGHTTLATDWRVFLDFADRHLRP